MGSDQSRPGEIEGFQIASIAPSSPAHEAGLIPHFDFVVGADGVKLDRENSGDFRQYIQKHKGTEVVLSIYNSKTRQVRSARLTPNDAWGGVGLLGCSITWENVDLAQEYVWHVTGVKEGSPAAVAGIVGGRDYIVGLQSMGTDGPLYITMFTDKSDFHTRLAYFNAVRSDPRSARNPRASKLLLMVYDSVDNSVREVLVDMGAHASLGCDVANGYLHCIQRTEGDVRLPVIMQFYIEPQEPEGAQPQPATGAPAAATATALPSPPAASTGGTLPNGGGSGHAAAATASAAPAAAGAADATTTAAAPAARPRVVLPPPPPMPEPPAPPAGAAAGKPLGSGQQQHPHAAEYREPAWATALNTTLS